jgi:hypothetical protein
MHGLVGFIIVGSFEFEFSGVLLLLLVLLNSGLDLLSFIHYHLSIIQLSLRNFQFSVNQLSVYFKYFIRSFLHQPAVYRMRLANV